MWAEFVKSEQKQSRMKTAEASSQQHDEYKAKVKGFPIGTFHDEIEQAIPVSDLALNTAMDSYRDYANNLAMAHVLSALGVRRADAAFGKLFLAEHVPDAA